MITVCCADVLHRNPTQKDEILLLVFRAHHMHGHKATLNPPFPSAKAPSTAEAETGSKAFSRRLSQVHWKE